MAMFPSISSFFSAPAQQPQQPAAPANELSNTTVPNANTPTSDGSHAAFPATKTGESSPLDGYKDIWQTPAAKGAQETLVPTITADPTAMMKAAQGYDFTKGMDPEMLQKATSGDATAFATVVNSAVQAGFAAAATAAANITKGALQEQARKFESEYAPNMLRNASITNKVSETVSLANDPAAAPIVSALRTQLSAKFPQASADEIATHVNSYLTEFAGSIAAANGGRIQSKSELETKQSSMGRPEQDWSAFFDQG